jgi:predicted nucleic acid-binding Zn ribbon protein
MNKVCLISGEKNAEKKARNLHYAFQCFKCDHQIFVCDNFEADKPEKICEKCLKLMAAFYMLPCVQHNKPKFYDYLFDYIYFWIDRVRGKE